ncbi:hypothetical protein [Amaricoccus macauensis]|uniref:hypothetical protein n=1 Tax=Amaricoccus macauensis TaxID=57001 RepID=UPI003C7E3C9D
MHHPDLISPATALREYEIFHSAIIEIRSNYLLVRFETVTQDFSSVIRALNERWNLGLREIKRDELSGDAFKLVDRLSMERGTVGRDGEPYSPNRSPEDKAKREQTQEKVSKLFDAPHLARAVERAKASYAKLAETADL